MKKLKYIYSPEALIRDSLNYRYYKVFRFKYVTNKLKTKNSIRNTEKIDFQEQLINAKKTQSKNIFKHDVAIQIDIHINQKNAPSIQNIPKCYIDLLWRPIDQFKNQNLILKDDDQIKYLKVNYKKSYTKYSILEIKILPYKRLLKDIELLFRLESGIFKYDIVSLNLGKEIDDEDEFKVNHSFYALENHLEEKESYIKELGEESFKYSEFWLKQQVQEIELNNQRIKNNQILNLYRGLIPLKTNLPFPDVSNLGLPVVPDLGDLWTKSFDILGDFIIENLPTKSGDKKIFKQKLIEKVNAYFEKRWFYTPMLNPIALSIFILPPKNHSKDFDNIAKDILPVYHDKLNPPTDFNGALRKIEQYRVEKHNNKSPLFKSEEFPLNGIMSYQIIQIPRLENSVEDGYIKVNFHNNYYHSSLIDYTMDMIMEYKEKLE